MIRTTKSEFDTIRSNNAWTDLNDNEESVPQTIWKKINNATSMFGRNIE